MSGNWIERMLSWSLRKLSVQNLVTGFLLAAIFFTLDFGLSDIVRGIEIDLLIAASLTGLLVGWVFARTRLPGWLALPASLAIGLWATLTRIGQLLGLQARLLAAANQLSMEMMRWRPLQPLPEPAPVIEHWETLWSSVSVLLVRIRDWLIALRSGNPSFDPVAVALAWSLAVWVLAVWAAWAVRRREQILAAITPAGLLLAASLAYVQQSAGILLFILAPGFLLVAWTNHSHLERRWQASGTDYSEELRFDVGIGVFFVSMALTVLAGLAPSISLSKIHDLFISPPDSAAPPVGRSLGLEPPQPTRPASPLAVLRRGGLPRSHLLGSGPELSQQIVLEVQTGELPPGLPETTTTPIPRHYWRSLTYDVYTGRGWLVGPTYSITYPAGEPVSASPPPAGRILDQEVRRAGEPTGLLYVSGELVEADQAVQGSWRVPPGSPGAPLGDLFGAVLETRTYRARSLIPAASPEQLRSAGTDYPAWVLSRFLTLPEQVPERVLALARDLTATAPTPYDRALAIQAYLRDFPYSLDLPLPPSDQDVVDYFLFDLRKGYCDYYASAMAILARAAGLPSRLAVGYASGKYDTYAARYVVTEADGHSWPEIYFPGYGWIRFEPTAGRALPNIGEGDESPDQPESENNQAIPGIRQRLDWQAALLWVSGAALGLLILGAAWVSIGQWRLNLLSPEPALITIYRYLYRAGRNLDIPTLVGSTPDEFASSFGRKVENLGKSKRWEGFLNPAAQEIRQLTGLYTQAAYSPQPPQAGEKSLAIQVWQRLRWRLWAARLLKRFGFFR